jgi:DNA-binding LacI/PurR family transcriptional regulator
MQVKNQVARDVFERLYEDGAKLAPERDFAEAAGVSRVTVRKAFALLEADGVIERSRGSGTVVRVRRWARPGRPEIIALVAPPSKPFFAAFVEAFQAAAAAVDALVLFMQPARGEPVEESLFRLYAKSITSVVVWPDVMPLDPGRIARLRALGCNTVFFDAVVTPDWNDCVLLDNRDAVGRIVGRLRGTGSTRLAYLGWDRAGHTSVDERLAAFREAAPGGSVLPEVPWSAGAAHLSRSFGPAVRASAERLVGEPVAAGLGAVAADGEVGAALRAELLALGRGDIPVACVDEPPDAWRLGLVCCAQPVKAMAEAVLERLLDQAGPPGRWRPAVDRLRGVLRDHRRP